MFEMPPQTLTSRLSLPTRSPQPTLITMPSSRHYTPSQFILEDDLQLKDVQTQRKQQANKENKDYLTQKDSLNGLVKEQKQLFKNLLLYLKKQVQSVLPQDYENQIMNNLSKMEKIILQRSDENRIDVLEEENRRLCGKLSQVQPKNQPDFETAKSNLLMREQENTYLRRQLQELKCFIEENNLKKEDQSDLMELVKHFQEQIFDLKSENSQLMTSLKDIEYEFISSKNQYEVNLQRVRDQMNDTLNAKELEMARLKQKPQQEDLLRDLFTKVEAKFSQQDGGDRQQLLQDIQMLQRDKKNLTDQLKLMSQDLKNSENSKEKPEKSEKFDQLKKKYIGELNMREQQEQEFEEKIRQMQKRIEELQQNNQQLEFKVSSEKNQVEQQLKFEKNRNNDLQQQINKLQIELMGQVHIQQVKEKLDTSHYYYEREQPSGNIENKFNDTVKSLKNELNTSQRQRHNLEQQIQDLQVQNDNLAKEINDLKRSQWNRDQIESQMLDKKFDQMKSDYNDLQAQLDSIRRNSQDSFRKDSKDGLLEFLKQQNTKLESKLERTQLQLENVRNSTIERSYQKDNLSQVIDQLQSDFIRIRKQLQQQVEKSQISNIEGMLQGIIDKFGVIEVILENRTQTSPIAQLLQSGPLNTSSSPLYRNAPNTKYFMEDENVYSFNPSKMN